MLILSSPEDKVNPILYRWLYRCTVQIAHSDVEKPPTILGYYLLWSINRGRGSYTPSAVGFGRWVALSVLVKMCFDFR